MPKLIYLAMLLLAAIPLWSQAGSDETAAATNPGDNSQMITPPPVSGESYPSTYASAERSNYLRAGLTFNTTYTDNALGGATTNPISDISYSVWPTLGLDKTTPRFHAFITYSPGFTVYQRTSSRNQANQNVGLNFQYRLSPHVTVSFVDSLSKSSSVFSQPDQLSATSVSGSAQAPTVAVIAPIASQLNNTGNAELTYQFSASTMVGAGGSFSNLHYLDSSQVPGLFDSNSAGGSAFYDRRLSKKHYVGAQYRYQRILAYPTGTQYETETHTISVFYTVYLKPALSLSLSGGPQHTDTPQPPLPESRSWSPAASASFGWQARHTNLAASYSRLVTGGGGLVGAYHSNTVNASVRQQLTKNWNAGAYSAYSIYKNVTPFFLLGSPGGHSVSGTASVRRVFGQHLNAELGYTRLHQSYSRIALISNAPNTNNEWVAISYQFSRPLGR
jgi:hypothetical protein